jgi:hypothetical protein
VARGEAGRRPWGPPARGQEQEVLLDFFLGEGPS